MLPCSSFHRLECNKSFHLVDRIFYRIQLGVDVYLLVQHPSLLDREQSNHRVEVQHPYRRRATHLLLQDLVRHTLRHLQVAPQLHQRMLPSYLMELH